MASSKRLPLAQIDQLLENKEELMTPITCVLSLVIQLQPAASVGSKLTSKRPSDVIAGLNEAAKLNGKVQPIISRICELVLDSNEGIAGAASDCLKAVAPQLQEPMLRIKKTPSPNEELKEINALGSDGLPLVFLIHKRLQANGTQGWNPTTFLRTLVKTGDTSERH